MAAKTGDWKHLHGWQLGLLAAITGCIFWLTLATDQGWVPLLDSANLAFHEAGHLIFGFLGASWGLYGGTLGQLVFPLVVTVRYFRARDAFAYGLGLLWLFENLLNIARYMADAREQVLPLVGGGEHDWTHILGRWGMLESDQSLAGLLQAIAVTGMLATLGWAFLQSRSQK